MKNTYKKSVLIRFVDVASDNNRHNSNGGCGGGSSCQKITAETM